MLPVVKNIVRNVRHALIDWKLRLLVKRKPLNVVIGASDVYQKGWVGTDISHLNLLVQRDWETYFTENSIDALLAEHVWEHLEAEDAYVAAKNCYRYLKPGSALRVAVPDGFHPSPEYVNQVRPGGSGLGADDHRVLYNYRTLTDVFTRAGFSVDLLEYFDETGSFHQKPWDPEKGLILRSRRYDERNKDGKLKYTSLIIDAAKK